MTRSIDDLPTIGQKAHSPRLGLFGGSFDPVHIGHLILATEAFRQLELDTVLFLPARQPPHKTDQTLASETDRCAMIEVAIAGRSVFDLSRIDLSDNGPGYSADLVERIASLNPTAELFFIIGGDSMRDFHTWHEPNRLAAAATIAVARRPSSDYTLSEVNRRMPFLNGRIVEIDMPLVDISSTVIRQLAHANEAFWYQVPLGVERYIEEHRLYRGR